MIIKKCQGQLDSFIIDERFTEFLMYCVFVACVGVITSPFPIKGNVVKILGLSAFGLKAVITSAQNKLLKTERFD